MKNKTGLFLMGFHSQGAQLGWLPVSKKIIIYAHKKLVYDVGSRDVNFWGTNFYRITRYLHFSSNVPNYNL